ncbi:MAG: RICIN domain-containing protein [Ruminobacter sp.]|nr:RICIN domain-containing protein [Ruminobacter sp.]
MNRTKTNHFYAVLVVLVMLFGIIGMIFPQAVTANAASVDYPAQLIRISTYDNSRNLNISGYTDKSALNTWTANGVQNENWRFDYVGESSYGKYYKITNMGTGKLITPLGYETSSGTSCVIFGSESAQAQHWYVTPVANDANGTALYYKITNYADPNMALTWNSSANTISLSAYTGANEQKWLLNTAGLQGFAGCCTDFSGSLKASDIGGVLGKTVEVTTFDELKTACTSTEPLTILITKNISGKTGSANYEISTASDGSRRYYCRDNYIYLQPNKTIIGSYSAHTLYNVYFRTYNENYGPGHDIIIRNIDCTHDTELNTDNIWEFAYGWNYWIDHCDLEGHAQIETSSLGSDDWDKLLNFKGTADNATISDCTFGHHEYGVLMGYPTDTQETYDTYNGRPCITLCDNYYNNTITRAPGLMRYGYFHSFNNYVVNFDMGYTIYSACKLYSENNYFEAGTGKGSVVNDRPGNDISAVYPGVYTDSGSILTGSNYSLTASYAQACTWRPTSNYRYTAKSASDVKAYCMANAGSKSSASAMTYAMYAESGVPSAGYVTAPETAMEEIQIAPLNGTLISELALKDKNTYQNWALLSSVEIGDKIYGDRDFTYTSIPAVLQTAEAVQTACEAKNSSGELAVLTAGEDCTVYVGLDSRVENLPSWMKNFTKTNMTASASNDVTFILYRLALKAGTTLSLGSNEQSAYCINYTVFVQKAKGFRCDVNQDGVFNVADIVLLQKWIQHKSGVTLPCWQAGDMAKDEKLNIFDLCLLKKALLSVPEESETLTASYEPANFKLSGKMYLVGDSTVCEYTGSTCTDYNRYGWGMKLGEQYNGGVVINYALAGRSSRSFLTETNYQTLCSNIGAGDYLFIQFGHNDEKTDEATYPGLGTYAGLDQSTLDSEGKDASGRYSYEWIILNKYIKPAQAAGAVPVLVTPITRRNADGTPNYAAHTAYQQALIQLGKEYNIPVIDATALTTAYYNQIGADNTAALHCWTDAEHTTLDNTHLSEQGAAVVAGIIAGQTKELGLTIGNFTKS